MLVVTVLSMLTLVCHLQKVTHRGWAYFQARLACTMATCNVLVQWHGLVSVNSFLDTLRPQIRLHQLRHTVAPVSPGQGLYIHADQSARSHCIDAETHAAPGGVLPRYQR